MTSPEAITSSSLFFSNTRRASIQSTSLDSTSSATTAYRFPFRRSSPRTSGSVAGSMAQRSSTSRSFQISNPTLISPAPTVATRDLPGAPSVSAQIKPEHISNSTATRSDESGIGLSGDLVSAPKTPPSSARKQDIRTKMKDISASYAPSTPHHTTPELALPTQSQLIRAAALPLITESGVRISFGSLFTRIGAAVIVIFIRHFWCPFDQDYVQNLVDVVRINHGIDDLIDDVQLVIISNGSHTLITKYRQIFKMPKRVEVFTDPTLHLYEALGMRMVGETTSRSVSNHAGASTYVKRGMLGGMATVVMRALKVGMPLWEKGGESKQLGGEFVFVNGDSCIFAHRMQTKHDHVPVADIFRIAASIMPKGSPSPTPPPEPEPLAKAEVSEGPSAPGPTSQRLEFRISNHPYVYHSHTLPVSSSPSKHLRRRTASLTSSDVRFRAAARKARVRASTIWTMDVKGYDYAGDGNVHEEGVEESESERWKRNLLSLRAEKAGEANIEKVSTQEQLEVNV
ncbi:hypothetical protein E1B28_010952 [Marasmius oreades]|uniref:Uncharacterized protein n=1 Tax=Marasmius oreades TaxID=181124 RepID=A0A9P7UPG4_9AGAR|nr:uncharacterized protein E1B28_010952 [Marasmius oreades]KAG7089253.1 hypothetical protein E1B28_010952 [Marasmius oreades]